MKLKVISLDGKKNNDVEISDKIFSLTPNKIIIQQLVYWQLNHFKARTAKTKQRGEVIGSVTNIYLSSNRLLISIARIIRVTPIPPP